MTPDALYDALIRLVEDGDSLVARMQSAPPADGTQAVLGLIHEIER